MRKIILASTALLMLGAAVPAYADATTAATTGAGVTTGATLGFILGGPVGAVIGGFSGAVIGSQVGEASVTYAGTHPVDEVYVDSDINVGFKVGGDIKIYPIEGDDAHGYFYANNRVWIVDRTSGEVVASPGYVVSEKAVAYAKAHGTTSIDFSGKLAPGVVLDSGITLNDVPDARGYAYVYVNDRPALVDAHSRTVIWIE